MTVHKAKGLQFPVVVLADPTCSAARDTPSRHVDAVRRLWLESLCGSAPVELLEAAAEERQREEDEAIRVAYVAATRARDLLVAPGCGDQTIEGWLSVLDPVLYPLHAARSTSALAPSCPKFGADSVFNRGKANIPAGGPVRPGLHHPIPGGPPVVWWDPSCLALEVEEPVPLRHQQILEGSSAGAAASEANHSAWMQEREALRARASIPSLTVQTVTALARSGGYSLSRERDEDEGHPATKSLITDSDVQVEMAARHHENRAGGRRFGALVHGMLAVVDLGADEGKIRSVATLLQRILDARQEEIESAIQTVSTALQHPVLRRAVAVGKENVRRETPVLLTLEDGTLAEGVVDLAFRETAGGFLGWTVVDFKTDHEFSGESTRYIRQVKLYAEAVRAATALPARGLILVI